MYLKLCHTNPSIVLELEDQTNDLIVRPTHFTTENVEKKLQLI